MCYQTLRFSLEIGLVFVVTCVFFAACELLILELVLFTVARFGLMLFFFQILRKSRARHYLLKFAAFP